MKGRNGRGREEMGCRKGVERRIKGKLGVKRGDTERGRYREGDMETDRQTDRQTE